MAYDEDFAHRIRELLADEHGLREKAMFGGLAFLLDGNMAVAISSKGALMVRLGPEAADRALDRPHVEPFGGTGKRMRGWIQVAPEGLKTKRQLASWVTKGVVFARSLPPK